MNYYDQLPEGYVEDYVIDAKNVKFGIVFNVIAIAVAIIIVALAVLIRNISFSDIDLIILLSSFVVLFVYIVLHELVHGLFYKIFTKRKLTFGITWSAAFCGVPELYVKKTPMLVTILAPFVVFSAILIPLMIFIESPTIYVSLAIILGSHLGGCSGDLYGAGIMLFKYSRHPELLCNDTGPKQSFYVKK